MSEMLLSARSLQRAYRGVRVLDVSELSVAQSEVLAILGPNGSGKSTLFRLLLGLERPDAGTIEITGTPVGVFQTPYLFTGTVRDNISYGLRDVGADVRQKRVATVASEFGLTSVLDKSVRKLSGGEEQRVALARALVLEPSLLLLDEPTASLDIMIKRKFREEVVRSARLHAGALIIITHDPAEAFNMADRIVVMDRGRIVQSGKPETLLEDPKTPFLEEAVYTLRNGLELS
ncbi:MAG TPA: ABC transporter ATP-binding protein [Longimicrobiales bacterium]|nr:ABC transporter ATP-binding protein [Longimicrobiales bacterium]